MAQILDFKAKSKDDKKKALVGANTIRLWHMDLDISSNISSAIRDGENQVVIAGLLANKICGLLKDIENKEDRYKIVNEICKMIYERSLK